MSIKFVLILFLLFSLFYGYSTDAYTQVLKFGEKGSKVKSLQVFLNNELKLNLPTTGYFGKMTVDAVNKFQLKYSSEILKKQGLSKPTGKWAAGSINKALSLIAAKNLNSSSSNYIPGLYKHPIFGYIPNVITSPPRINSINNVFNGSIYIDSPSNSSVFSPGLITVSGHYVINYGEVRSVEGRFNNGSWQSLAYSITDKTFSGSMNVEYGVGNLEVRVNGGESVSNPINLTITDIYLIAGQSNSEGQATNLQAYTGVLGSKMFNNGEWKTLADPVVENNSKGTSYPLIANILESELGRPIAFVVGKPEGGTGLVNPSNWTKGGTNYNETLARLSASGVNSIKAILWYQGERDIKSDVSMSAYQNALSQMLADFQNDSAALSDTPLIATIVGPSDTGTDFQIDQIRKATFNAATANDNIYIGPDASSVFNPIDNLHWKTDGEMLRLAGMWSRSILGYFHNRESPYGPIVATTTVGAPLPLNVVKIDFISVGDIIGTNSTTGWSLADDGGNVPIVSLSKTGKTITLTAERDLYGPVILTYASGDNARGSDLVDSGSVVGMPIQPIYGITAGIGGGSPVASSLLNDLVAWWKMEESSGNRADSSGNTNTLIQSNTVGSGSGVVGNAAYIVANSSFPSLTAPDSSSMNFSNGFAVSMWIKTTVQRPILQKGAEFSITWSGSNLLFRAGNASDSGADGRKIIGATDLVDGNWHHLVVTYPASGPQNGTMWIDGVRRDTTSNYFSPGWTAWKNTTDSFEFAKQSFGGETLERWVDELAIWNRDLTELEISTLYNSGSGYTLP